MKILIDKKTVKLNPNAGRTSFTVPVSRTVYFTFKGRYFPYEMGEEPEGVFIDSIDYPLMDVEQGNFEITVEGQLHHESLIHLLPKEAKISIKQENTIVNHLPEPRYLFKYEDPKIQCSNCRRKFLVSKVEEEAIIDDDGNQIDNCPDCESFNTFDEREYQPISEIIDDIEKILKKAKK